MVIVQTATSCRYEIDEDQKLVTGGCFGKDKVPYCKVELQGVGSKIRITTKDKEYLTAPVKSLCLA